MTQPIPPSDDKRFKIPPGKRRELWASIDPIREDAPLPADFTPVGEPVRIFGDVEVCGHHWKKLTAGRQAESPALFCRGCRALWRGAEAVAMIHRTLQQRMDEVAASVMMAENAQRRMDTMEASLVRLYDLSGLASEHPAFPHKIKLDGGDVAFKFPGGEVPAYKPWALEFLRTMNTLGIPFAAATADPASVRTELHGGYPVDVPAPLMTPAVEKTFTTGHSVEECRAAHFKIAIQLGADTEIATKLADEAVAAGGAIYNDQTIHEMRMRIAKEWQEIIERDEPMTLATVLQTIFPRLAKTHGVIAETESIETVYALVNDPAGDTPVIRSLRDSISKAHNAAKSRHDHRIFDALRATAGRACETLTADQVVAGHRVQELQPEGIRLDLRRPSPEPASGSGDGLVAKGFDCITPAHFEAVDTVMMMSKGRVVHVFRRPKPDGNADISDEDLLCPHYLLGSKNDHYDSKERTDGICAGCFAHRRDHYPKRDNICECCTDPTVINDSDRDFHLQDGCEWVDVTPTLTLVVVKNCHECGGTGIAKPKTGAAQRFGRAISFTLEKTDEQKRQIEIANQASEAYEAHLDGIIIKALTDAPPESRE